MDFVSELKWRGLYFDMIPDTDKHLRENSASGYIGFDPTSTSLGIGNLVQIMILRFFENCGHRPVALLGGATGMIGDPSGKSAERNLLSKEQLEFNKERVKDQLSKYFDFGKIANAPLLLDNHDWFKQMTLLDFLRDAGKHLTVNYMIAKESVKSRMDTGISYTEFSYQLIQAYDYYWMNKQYGVSMQMGGSDQWGNITAGVDFIRRMRSAKAHGLVMPLITTASGTKFGKTESGAVWLDATLTSPFRFYQFWLNAEDNDVGRYLRYFTFLDRHTIEQLEDATRKAPESREAQRALAREVTRMVHGEEHVSRAERASSVLFGEDITTLAADDVLSVFDDVPSSTLGAEKLAGEGVAIVDLLASSGLTTSKGEATRLIRGGGVYVNNRRITDERARLRSADAIEGRLFVLRKGAKQNHLVKIAGG